LWLPLQLPWRRNRREWTGATMPKAEREPTLAMKRTAAQKRDRARYGAKREKILTAAGIVLQRNGLAGTSIEAIAKEAGVDRATIYYYFSDKGAIFREAIAEGLDDMVSALEKVAMSDDPPEVRLRSAFHALLWAFEKHYPQLYIYLRSGDESSIIIDKHLNDEMIASGRRFEDLVEGIMRDGMKQGVFATSLPPKVFAKSVTGMLNWTSRWFVPGGALGAVDIADGMADTILTGVMTGGKSQSSRLTADG
jgi:TetR/AcrR family transcriptional regulator, cholesterol catabolism regulator